MKRYDYSGLIKVIGEIKTNQTKAINEELLSQKQQLADLEHKVITSGMLEDWTELKRTCRQVGIRLFPYGGYNSVTKSYEENTSVLMNDSYFQDEGMFATSCGVHRYNYGFIYKDGSIVWQWWFIGKPVNDSFCSEKEKIATKISILERFLDTYEEYREIQLQRVMWAMGEIAENTRKIRESGISNENL